MGKIPFLLIILLASGALVECKRGTSGGSSWGRRGSSRGKSASTSSTSSGGWFSWGKSTSTSHVPAAAPKPAAPASAPGYGWSNPSSKPSWSSPSAKPQPKPAPSYGGTSHGWNAPKPAYPAASYPAAKPAYPAASYPAAKPAYPAASYPAGKPAYPVASPAYAPAKPAYPATNTGWQKPSAPPLPSKPAVASVPLQKSAVPTNAGHGQTSGTGSYGWSNPGQAKPAAGFTPNTAKSNLPSSNIGAGGYPVQKTGLNPPPYTPTNTHGTTFNQGRVNPPAYSPHGAPPAYSSGTSYNGPKKQIINNHYHYSSPSQYGMSSSHYPTQNSFGYPGGGYFGNSRPSYGGMGMFSGSSGYGYPGSGSWGGYGGGSYGSSGSGSMVKGLLIGAAGGYLANSLIRRVTNPWGYSGSGYGYGYTDRYSRHDERRYEDRPVATTPAPYDPTAHWIQCVAFDPVTKQTLINPNCTCTVSTTTDQVTGQNVSHHDCTPPASMVPSPPLPVWGVNNPPPSFNGSLYGDGSAYGGAGYGAGGYGQPGGVQPYQQPGGVQPYPQPGAQPYQQPGGVQPYPQPGVQPYQQPGGVQPYQQPGGVQPYQQTGGVQPYPQPGVQPYQQPGGMQPYQPPAGFIPYQPPEGVNPQQPVLIPQTQPIVQEVAPQPALSQPSDQPPVLSDIPSTTAAPVSEPLVGEDTENKRKEFYSQLTGIVNMGRFER